MPVINRRIADRPIAITNPNGTVMYSTHVAELDIPQLPIEARRVHLVPDIHTSLLAIAPLCDVGCTVTFSKTDVVVHLDDKIVLTGQRMPITNLWSFDIPTSPPAEEMALLTLSDNTWRGLVAFYQNASCC